MADAIDWAAVRAEAVDEFVLASLPTTISLPALPLAVTRFAEQAGQPDVSLKKLADIVETDTGLTVELLRHVNGAQNALRHRAANPLQAMTLLGLRPAKTFLLTIGVQAAVKARQSKLVNQTCFWNASLQRALFAREVAGLLRADAETAFAGALLQDFLLPVLTNDLYDDYVAFVGRRDEQPQQLCDYERTKFGFDHAHAAACLAFRWSLPDELICCIRHHHLGLRALVHPVLKRSPVAAVALSALLPDQLRQDYSGLLQLVKLQEKWPAFDLRTLTERVDTLHAEMGAGVQNDFPLARRCAAVLMESTLTPAAFAAACVDGSLKRSAV